MGPPSLRAASRRAGYLDGINNAARAGAAGSSAPALIDQASSQLVYLLLLLRSGIFHYGAAGRPGCSAAAR